MIVPFEIGHIKRIKLQEKQSSAMFTKEILSKLGASDAYTVLEGDEVVACAGISEIYPGRALAWAYLSRDVGRRIIEVFCGIKRFVDSCPVHRIEMDVECDFPQGHRMARMLGFELEAERRRAFSPDGRDYALYARVK